MYGKKFPDKIIDNLYLSSMYESRQYDALKEIGIKYIFVAGSYLTQHFPDDFVYKQIFINDDPMENISIYFKDGIEYYNLIQIYKRWYRKRWMFGSLVVFSN